MISSSKELDISVPGPPRRRFLEAPLTKSPDGNVGTFLLTPLRCSCTATEQTLLRNKHCYGTDTATKQTLLRNRRSYGTIPLTLLMSNFQNKINFKTRFFLILNPCNKVSNTTLRKIPAIT